MLRLGKRAHFAALALAATSLFVLSEVRAAPSHGHALAFKTLLKAAPGVSSKAKGTAVFKLHSSEVRMDVTLKVTQIQDVTAVHLHQGPPGEVGPVVATLYGVADPAGAERGKLFCRTVTKGDLQGPLTGQTIHELVELMEEGQVYISVETVQQPGGEIRGQVIAPAHSH